MSAVIDAIRTRRARRAFSAASVPPDVERALWEAVRLAPSHGNAQPTRILVARSPETRAALIDALSPGNRNWAPAAPLLCAVAALPSVDYTAENFDGTSRELWAFHAGLATGNLLVQATAMGLVAHPMASFDEPTARRAFGAPEELRILAIVAIGYPGDPASLPDDLRAKEEAPQWRLPLDIIVAEDRWRDENAIGARAWRQQHAQA
ncbi:NADH dehydrogenase [bacterium HR29]|nr:NADH dehydrogenase [bacterium HR29]